MVPKDCDVVGGERETGSHEAETISYVDFRFGDGQTHCAAAAGDQRTETAPMSIGTFPGHRENVRAASVSDAACNTAPGNIAKNISATLPIVRLNGMNGVWNLY